tara:strand:+ start:15708 stop:16526 length:819 start_codon:yes stop_codon:yes gene_type:complete
MKKYLLLVCVACTLVACEDVEENSPAFQGNLDNVFYKSLDAQATLADDGSISIVGATSDQQITLVLSVFQGGSFMLNSGNGHQAFYEDGSGQLYSTENGGDGVVNITGRGEEGGVEYLSGDFNFNAILPGVDTVTVDRGLLFKVPVISGTIEDPTNPSDPNQDGAFVAEIDGELFDPSTVVATTTDTSIVIIGALGDNTIQLVIPLDAEPASQAIPGAGFNASYFIAGDEEQAISGAIRVVTHDMTAQGISGTFNFMTENHQISLGQFNIDY